MPVTGQPGDSITLNGVTAQIWAEGYSKGNDIEGGGPFREIIYKVAWADSDTFMDGLMGLPRSGSVPGGTIIYQFPHPYPGNAALVCHSVKAVPGGSAQPDASKLFAADFCLISATYRVMHWNISGNTNGFNPPQMWSSDSCRGFTQSYPVSTDQFVDQTDGTYTPSGNVDIYLPHIEFIRKRTKVPYFFVDTMASLNGHVNNATFFGRATGTVLFGPFDMSELQASTDGSYYRDYVMTFTWRAVEWNAFLRDDKIQWDIWKDSAGNYIYPYSDLSPLVTDV